MLSAPPTRCKSTEISDFDLKGTPMTRNLLLPLALVTLCSDRIQAQDQPPKPTYADVSYGPHERNVLDFYKADSKTPTPLIVYIHGGGFVGGNKQSINGVILRGAVDSGISV